MKIWNRNNTKITSFDNYNKMGRQSYDRIHSTQEWRQVALAKLNQYNS